jgi:SAM-dependent methyltransferase
MEKEGAMSAPASPDRRPGPCPICGSAAFVPGPKGRMAPNGRLPRCAGCASLERHRIFRVMFERLGPQSFATWRAIQFSPDPTIDPAWFASHELAIFGEGESLDIQAIARPDAAYDLVACSHVLEHVADDAGALRELMRIAKPDGLVFLATPDPFREETTRDWGYPKPEKHGHYRVYGADIAALFARALPDQPVISYMGEDPVTGEREGCFLLPRSPAASQRLRDRLGADAQLFAGPALSATDI